MPVIGTLGERSLHAAVKRFCEPDETRHEIPLGRFVADICGEEGILEVQTQQFHLLRGKLAAFLPECPVTVVYPIPRTKQLQWLDSETGELLRQRLSPRRGSAWDCFRELYRIQPFLPHPNFRLRLLLLDVAEQRYESRKNRKGYTRVDLQPLRPLEAGDVECIELRCPQDYTNLLPVALPPAFTTAELGKAAGIPLATAQTALRVMAGLGAVQCSGKAGRWLLYERNTTHDTEGDAP
ncbi:MAG: hypothetical protein LBS96_05030 [Oscillospiraceae bacterium]|jgi:hypothetical protein|nr:hypothetical protein [Oscillospiraceae bacterium]